MSGAFHTQDVHQRIHGGTAGRIAEGAFLRWLEATKGYRLGERVEKRGLNEVSTKYGMAATLLPWQRMEPDFRTIGGHCWEVEGTASDWFDFKADKLEALNWWAGQLAAGNRDLRWFLYQSHLELATFADHATVLAAVEHPEAVWFDSLYDDGAKPRPGWRVPARVFEETLVAGDPFRANRLLRENEQETTHG